METNENIDIDTFLPASKNEEIKKGKRRADNDMEVDVVTGIEGKSSKGSSTKKQKTEDYRKISIPSHR